MHKEKDHLEKARLQLKRIETLLASILEEPPREGKEKFFEALTSHAIAVLKVKYALVTECMDDPATRVKTLAFWKDGRIDVDSQFELADTPCEEVIKGKNLNFREGIQKFFPKDRFLIDLKIQSYLARPLRDSGGKVIGHFAILDDKPMTDDVLASLFVQISAARASVKLERKRLKKNLLLSQFTFERSSLPIYWVAANARFFYVNPAAMKALGYSQEELTSMTVHDIDPGFPLSVWEAHWKKLKNKGSLIFESSHRKKDGHIFPVELNVNFIEFEGQEYSCAFARDISEYKKAKKELDSQRNFLRQIININPNVIFAKDREGRYTLVNEALAKIYGNTIEKIVGKTDANLNPNDEEVERIRKDDLEVMDSLEEKIIPEERITDSAGMIHWYQTVKRPIINEKNTCDQILGVATDITERKRMEQSILESEKRFRLMADSAPVMIWMSETTKECSYFNKVWLDFTGKKIEDEIGNGWEKGVHSKDLRSLKKTYYTAFDHREAFTIEYRLKRWDGEYRWVLDSGVPRCTQEGEFAGYIGTCLDIADLKEAEKKLRHSRDELENKVQERTSRLSETNRSLQDEILKRKHAEEKLRKLNNELEKRIGKRTADLSKAFGEVRRLKNRLQQENIYLQQEIKLTHNFEEIVFKSEAIKKILHKIEKVAKTNATVLILGETGTGKELIARAIHNLSTRKERSLIKVNCATLPAPLIESELFGHEKGAFTGAHAKRIGRFELAHEGSIFLDEMGDLPIVLQSKLLRVLQESEFERVGGHMAKKVDVRIIAATHQDLESLVRLGKFREDLFYRLNVIPIKLPPLRKRKEDIPLLAKHFIQKYSLKTGKMPHSISESVISKLMDYNWPGNIRELENVIERAVVLTQGKSIDLSGPIGDTLHSLGPAGERITTLAGMEESMIKEALEACNWKIQGNHGAAKRLGIPPSTLRDRIRKYGLKKTESVSRM